MFADRGHFAVHRAVSSTIGCPIVNKPAPPVEQISAPAGPLYLVSDRVRKGQLGHFMGIAGALGCLVAEARTEAMHRRLIGPAGGTST